MRDLKLNHAVSSIALSPGENQAVALSGEARLTVLRLSRTDAFEVEASWDFRSPLRAGNRLKKVDKSSVVCASTDRALIVRQTSWQRDPESQVCVTEIDLRTGAVVGDFSVPCNGSVTILQPVLLASDLLLVGQDNDGLVIHLTAGKALGTLRQSLWITQGWESDAADAAYGDDSLCYQGLAWDAHTETVHALFQSGETRAFVESYKWHRPEQAFKVQKRRMLRNVEGIGLALNSSGMPAAFVTGNAREIAVPKAKRADFRAELGELILFEESGKRSVPVQSDDPNDFLPEPARGAATEWPERIAQRVEFYPAFPCCCGGARVILNTPSGTILSLDMRTGKCHVVERLEAPVTACAYAATKGLALFGCADGRMIVRAVPRSAGLASRQKPLPQLISPRPDSPKSAKSPQLRMAERRIRDMLAEGGTAVYLTEMRVEEVPALLLETTAWERIGLGSCGLRQIPEAIGTCRKLRELTADHNALRGLPHSLVELRALALIDLTHNELGDLPDDFGNLTKLRELKLGNNRLRGLPISFGKLKSLTELDLSHCPLNEVPRMLRHLSKLEKLCLRGTGIRVLPSWLGELTRLRDLDLSQNAIRAIPGSLRKLVRLEYLALAQNRLRSVPAWLGAMKSLQELGLSQCPELRTIPEEVFRIGEVDTFGTPAHQADGIICRRCARFDTLLSVG